MATETFRAIKEMKLSTRALGVLRHLGIMGSQADRVVDVREKLFALAESQRLPPWQILARAPNCGKLTAHQLAVAFAVPRPLKPRHCPTCRCVEHGDPVDGR